MKMSEEKEKFLKKAAVKFGYKFAKRDMFQFVREEGNPPRKDWGWMFNKQYRISHGIYQIPNNSSSSVEMISNVVQMTKKPTLEFNPNVVSEFNRAEVPSIDKFYIPFGEYKDIATVIRSKKFFPVFICGLSGNGKTVMIEQESARANRALVRVQMTRETDEDELIGGFRLIDGETKFMKGPVLRAMEQGSLLLIDEADRADASKVMCIQGILEGKSYYIKKTGELIIPALGFNVFVTANTKGKGSDDGRYISANILDDSWLERFPNTIEQNFPSISIETKILNGYLCHDRNCDSKDMLYVDNLVAWANIIRKTFEEGAIDEIISTRRLVHIIQTYRMFNDRSKAISMCINRFDEETKNSFLELYEKVDSTISEKEIVVSSDGAKDTNPSVI